MNSTEKRYLLIHERNKIYNPENHKMKLNTIEIKGKESTLHGGTKS